MYYRVTKFIRSATEITRPDTLAEPNLRRCRERILPDMRYLRSGFEESKPEIATTDARSSAESDPGTLSVRDGIISFTQALTICWSRDCWRGCSWFATRNNHFNIPPDLLQFTVRSPPRIRSRCSWID
jgi:hypothetical protein